MRRCEDNYLETVLGRTDRIIANGDGNSITAAGLVKASGTGQKSCILCVWWYEKIVSYPLSYRVPARERYGSTLLPATREQHDQNCTQSH